MPTLLTVRPLLPTNRRAPLNVELIVPYPCFEWIYVILYMRGLDQFLEIGGVEALWASTRVAKEHIIKLNGLAVNFDDSALCWSVIQMLWHTNFGFVGGTWSGAMGRFTMHGWCCFGP